MRVGLNVQGDEIKLHFLHYKAIAILLNCMLVIMAVPQRDETDATVFRATLDLRADADVEDAAPLSGRHESRCIRSIWMGHRTLLMRLAVFIFFVLLITLLETLLPDKKGIIGALFGILVSGNGTIGYR